MNEQGSKPWWKEPWPWILISGPAVAVVGCAVTIVLAVQNFGDQAYTGGAVKRGLVVDRLEAGATGPQATGGAAHRADSSGSTP